MHSQRSFTHWVLLSLLSFQALAGDGNRLTCLDESDPFHVGLNFPKLTTPQWIGEDGVEAVVTLGIDDMRNNAPKYEQYLRPILDRLRQIDSRAPVSIFCNQIAAEDAQVRAWLAEGLSIEVHTLTHPCPILAKTNFLAAAETFHGCVDMMSRIPGNPPVAFRTPCCDSINSPSPRLFAEIFNGVSTNGNFLTADSSVMNILTSADSALPRELVLDADGRDKFRKYVPFPSFVTTIENYPYPYVLGKLCWEFPAMVPSDWEAQHLHGTNNPITVADWKAALDATVIKQGTFNFIFHPHGWIASTQMVEFIDYAVSKYGKRVKFLNYREAVERLNKNLLAGQLLRAANGRDNGVRLLDVNHDGYLDVIIGNEQQRKTRVWQPAQKSWKETDFPAAIVAMQPYAQLNNTGVVLPAAVPTPRPIAQVLGSSVQPGAVIAPIKSGYPFTLLDSSATAVQALTETGVRFGVVQTNGFATALLRNDVTAGAWHFDGERWVEDKSLLAGLSLDARPLFTGYQGHDMGVRLRDVDNDGRCELLIANIAQNAVFSWSDEDRTWMKARFTLPQTTSLVNVNAEDAGLRFVDLNGDGFDDVVFSDERQWSVNMWINTPRPNLGIERGWSFNASSGLRGETGEPPMFVRGGTNRNNGAWFHSKQLWVQNEDTAHLPDLVDRRSFDSLIIGAEQPAKSPDEALKSFQVRPGFKVELVASEPLVIDPVAFEWGADGKLWVAEMRDYPLGMDGHGKPGGVIKFLEDTDGDGRYDKATVFLEGVNFPNGVMPWGKGVLVSAAPEIFYAEDRDGDGKAEVRRTILQGFVEGNQQHRVNGFEYGLDGWIYAANGDSSGKIYNTISVSKAPAATAPPIPDRPTGPTPSPRDLVDLRGHDLRFNPDSGAFQLVAGQTQFGRRRDDWGNWFGNNNPTWLWHYYVPVESMTAHAPLEWKTTRRILANYDDPNRIFAISQPQRRFNWPEAIRQVTSANSPAPYRDELFGADFATSVFISEPANNVVHREVLEPNGVTFKSHRAADEQDREFLASTDNWFRPTMLKTGPDGALYIADMYRLVLEHPEYFPEELRSRPDLRAGDDKGRIWRVYPEGSQPRQISRLDKLDLAGLIAALDSPNGWQRDTAQRLLTERAMDMSSSMGGIGRERLRPEHLSSLGNLAAQNPNPKVRVAALATLGTLGALRPSHLKAGFEDEHPVVRALAVRSVDAVSPFGSAGRNVFSSSEERATILQALSGLTNDPSAFVRFELALVLGRQGVGLTNVFVNLALRETDPQVQAAILNAVGGAKMSGPGLRAAPLLPGILAWPERGEWVTRLLSHLARVAVDQHRSSEANELVAKAISTTSDGEFALWQMRMAAAWLDGVEAAHGSLAALGYEVKPVGQPQQLAMPQQLVPLFIFARSQAADPSTPEVARIAAIRLLGRNRGDRSPDLTLLASLLKPTVPAACQSAALDGLKRWREPAIGDALLAEWPELSPSLRNSVLSVLLSREAWTDKLLAALERGNLTPAEIAPAHQQTLLKQKGDAVRQRAEKVFTSRQTDRQQILRNYEHVRDLIGDAARGAVLYQQNCATCHKVKNEGFTVGPDLGTVADKPVGTLLVALLDPNQAVDAAYQNYTVETRSGRELSGIIAADTLAGITIRAAGGVEETIPRGDIERFAASKVSLMPEGLETILPPQAMADLIAFIRSR